MSKETFLITLIHPPNFGEKKHPLLNARPLGLHVLASALEMNPEFKVEILDLRLKKNDEETLSKKIKGRTSQLYGITGLTASRFDVVKIAKVIKQTDPSAMIMVGGPHFSFCAEETLKKVEEIDIVVRGIAVKEVSEVAKNVKKKSDFEGIPNISYRKNGSIIHHPKSHSSLRCIDELPIYSKFSNKDYSEFLRIYPEKIPAISVISSVGCTGNCIFCAKVINGYHFRDSKKVVDEILFFRENFGFEAFNFIDMTFTGNAKHVKKMCSEIIQRAPGIRWWCESRADIDLDLLEFMKTAGCVSLAVGIETGSARILSNISKGVTIEKIIRFCKKCDQLGIFIRTFFMFSHLGETKKDIKDTFRLIKKIIKFPHVKVSALQPTMIFPGSKLETLAKEQLRDFSWYEPYENELNRKLNQISNIPIFLDALHPEELVAIREKVQRYRKKRKRQKDRLLRSNIAKNKG